MPRGCRELPQRQFAHIGQGATLSTLVSLVAVVTAILSLLMIAATRRLWRREYAGLGKSLSTFAVSFGVVAVYYTILVVWFLAPDSRGGRHPVKRNELP